MLLVTPGRKAAIDNIRKAAAEGRFNDKTEPFDPQWERDALKANILNYVRSLDSPAFKLKNLAARAIVDIWRRKWSDGINEIRGFEKLQAIDGPASSPATISIPSITAFTAGWPWMQEEGGFGP